MHTGVVAELGSAAELVRAIRVLRERGYRDLDAFTPYPVREVEDALGLPRSRLPWLVLLFALLGAAGGYLVQWYLSADVYPLDAGGRPPHAAPAFVPIAFESGVLAAALSTTLGLLVLCRLPALWHPAFEAPGFERATLDRFWVGIDARDPSYSRVQVTRDLRELGALAVEWAGEAPR